MTPPTTARITQYAAAVINSTSSASGLLNRNIIAAAGVHASTTPASRPAAAPWERSANARRTVKYSTATEATPMTA